MDEARVARTLDAVTALAAVGVLLAALASLRWPIVHDAALMHYVGWRLYEGDLPWVDFLDVNLPGTYLFHLGVHALFGTSAVAWRLVDLGLAALGAVAIHGLLRPSGAAAARLGAVLWPALHLYGGAPAAGQRDFVVAVLQLLAAWGLVAWSEGRARTRWLVGVGAALAFAVTIKPTGLGLLAVVVGLVAWWAGRRAAPPLAALLGGVGIVAAVELAWLASLGVITPMLDFWTGYMPLYRDVGKPASYLLLRLRETPHFGLVVLAPFHLLTVRRERPVLAAVSAAGLVLGAVHFYAQKKGYSYHLYPWAAFAVPAGMAALQRSWATFPWRTLGPVSLIAVLLALVVDVVVSAFAVRWDADQMAAAEAIAASARPGERIETMDLAEGGLQGLLYARVPQASRFLYDFYFYHDRDSAIVQRYRAEWVAAHDASPPDRIVIFNKTWPHDTWKRVSLFPELEARLARDYDLEREAAGARWYRRRAVPSTPAGASP